MWIQKWVKQLGLGVLVASAFLGAEAQARCWVEWQGIKTKVVCDSSEGGGAGISYSTLSIKNECRYPIFVAVHYKSMRCQEYPGNHSCLSEYIPDDKLWVTDGFWRLNPGQTSYIKDTRNRYLYTYAETDDNFTGGSANRMTWSGDKYFTIKGRSLGFKQIDIGAKSTQYTHRFTCN